MPPPVVNLAEETGKKIKKRLRCVTGLSYIGLRQSHHIFFEGEGNCAKLLVSVLIGQNMPHYSRDPIAGSISLQCTSFVGAAASQLTFKLKKKSIA